MKKIISVLVAAVMLCSTSAFAEDALKKAQDTYADMISTALEKSNLGEDADSEHIYIIEECNYIELSKGNAPVRYYVAIPMLGSDEVNYAYFKNGEYVTATVDLPLFDGIESPFGSTYARYIEDNGISDISEVTVMAVFERLHMFAFYVKTADEEYIIPHYFLEDSVFNLTDDEACRLEKGEAYPVEEFISICEKEAVLFAEYRRKEREEKNKTVIAVNEDGDEVVISGRNNLEDIKSDILDNVEIMEKGSTVSFNIKSDEENYIVKYSYDDSSDRDELDSFVNDFFEELYVQAGQTSDEFSGVNCCCVKLRHKENGKWVQHLTYIDLSEDKIRLRTANYGDVILKLKNPDAIFDYLKSKSLNGFSSFNEKYTDENTPATVGNTGGFTKTDAVEFEFILPEKTENDISKEVAAPGQRVVGKFEAYKENKYNYVYILTLSGDKGKISLYNEKQLSLSGDSEKLSYNLPIAFLNQCRYEEGNLLMYSVKDSNSYSLKLVFENGDIKKVVFGDTECDNLKYTSFTESTAVQDIFSEREKSSEGLKELGIMNGDPDGNMRLDDEITRAEATALLVRLHKALDKNVSCEFAGFSDMKGHWADEEITYAKNAGITDGTGETTFSPEMNITVQEFAKMLVSLLGYRDNAEKKGGYPYEYMAVAEELGLMSDLSASASEAAVRGDVALMLDYALDIPIVENESKFLSDTEEKTFRSAIEEN